MISILAFFFVLGVLVIIHEAGHFLMARALGAPVEVFSVGFGKRIWGFERGGTDYRLSLIPFGGYVRIIGLGPDETDVVSEDEEGAEPVAEIELLPRWKRALILFAGPITNVIGAALFIALAYMIGIEAPAYLEEAPVIGWVEPGSPSAEGGLMAGDLVLSVDGVEIPAWRDLDMATVTAGGREITVTVERGKSIVDITFTPDKVSRYEFGYSGIRPPLDSTVVRLQPNSPAERAGLEPGDRIVTVNGEGVVQFYDLIRLISPHPGEEISLQARRGTEILDFTLVPADDGSGSGKIGIALVHPTALRKLGPLPALNNAIAECRRMTAETFRVIGRLLSRRTSIKQVSGPLDIAFISGEAAKSGLNSLVWLMGLISLQLGIFNLLPIPILDGGHLTIIAFESTIRRDLSLKVKERILEVGFYLLMLLMVVVLFNDIVKRLPENLYRFFVRG